MQADALPGARGLAIFCVAACARGYWGIEQFLVKEIAHINVFSDIRQLPGCLPPTPASPSGAHKSA